MQWRQKDRSFYLPTITPPGALAPLVNPIERSLTRPPPTQKTHWRRKSPKNSEVLPLLYVHDLPSGGFVPALEQFLGSSAGLPPARVTRLTPSSGRPTTPRS